MNQIYLAGPLFSLAEIEFNQRLCDYLISLGYKVFLPQNECRGKEGREIFETCENGINTSSVVLAILDGADADSGTCWECGYAYAKGLPIIALRTDFRQSGDTKGFNAMLYYTAAVTIDSPENYREKVSEALQKISTN
ncbi:MAG: nucleoside 2-deoxyribosyltransferase [Bacteroidota bacterium]|nr:nucleoside 2-deoxyribosyltransferase [Bacteroidota bacterium]